MNRFIKLLLIGLISVLLPSCGIIQGGYLLMYDSIWNSRYNSTEVIPLTPKLSFVTQNAQEIIEIPKKVEPSAEVSIKPQGKDFVQAVFKINMPSLNVKKKQFSVKAIDTSVIKYIRVEVTGLGISTPITSAYEPYSGSGTFTITLNNIPVGAARIATLNGYGDAPNYPLIPGTTLKAVFNAVAGGTNINMSYRSTAVAQVIEGIFGDYSNPANNVLATTLNLTELLAKIDAITGPAPNYPNIHPLLVKTSQIAADLIANGGNLNGIDPNASKYKLTGGTLKVNITGLVGTDKCNIYINDPCSDTSTLQLGNGTNQTVSSKIAIGGPWIVTAVHPDYNVSYNPSDSFTTTSGSTTTISISFTPKNTPIITSINPAAAKVGATGVVINGANFRTNINDNIVRFGTTQATVTAANNTQLTVTVPAGLYGTVPVTVSVGAATSNSFNFSIIPEITGFSANSSGTPTQTSGTVTTHIFILGTGFHPTAANNIVTFNTVPVNAADIDASGAPTRLRVRIPVAPTGEVKVQVGSQISAGVNFNTLPLIATPVLIGPPENISGTKVKGTVILATNVISGNGVASVEFFNGGVSMGAPITPPGPYNFSWNTTTGTSGAKNITAKVTEVAPTNNTATSSPLSVTVDQLPVITSVVANPNPILGAGFPTLLTCNVTDESPSSLSYEWSVDGAAGTFTKAPGQSSTNAPSVIWNPPSNPLASYNVWVKVKDPTWPQVTSNVIVNIQTGTSSGNTGSGGWN